jgi:hypothetical protein
MSGVIPSTTSQPIMSKKVFVVSAYYILQWMMLTLKALLWVFFGIATVALILRLYIRLKCFRRLLVDDYLAGFAWLLLLMSVCIWSMTIDSMYELYYVSAGMALPSANFTHNSHRFLVGANVAWVMFYIGLWSIKLSFLVFFYRLGNQIRTYQILWWVIFGFTIASGLACIGTIQYHCLSDAFEKIIMHCHTDAAVRYQEITTAVNCALDIVTDVMSKCTAPRSTVLC